MKKFLASLLISFARRVIAREHPTIIAITGSVGKTSAKQAIATVLAGRFSVRASDKNYNNEIGLPSTVLGLEPAGSSVAGWFVNLCRAWRRATFAVKDYPKTLVLEMGADRPGDIARLVAIAPPHLAVVTAVGESHAEFFGSIEDIVREKQTIVVGLGPDDVAVLCRDDERVWGMRAATKARVVSFGFHEEALVRTSADSVRYSCGLQEIDEGHGPEKQAACGMHFELALGGTVVPIFLPGVLGRAAIMAALVGAAVGQAQGLAPAEISARLREYVAPAGRMRLIAGIKRSYLIDDSYNSAPRSALAALEALRDLPRAESATTFAVLGDMLELGALTEKGHREVGRRAAESGVGQLVLVGERMGFAAAAATEAGLPAERIVRFGTAEEAGRFVQGKLREGDVVLVKGSQSMRLERVVRELMAEPLAAPRLLVRQEDYWLQTP